MKKIILFVISFLFISANFIFAPALFAESDSGLMQEMDEQPEAPNVEEFTFRAKVIDVIEQKVEGEEYYQDLKLTGKTGEYKGKTLHFFGVRDNLTAKYLFEEGDVVYVSVTIVDGQENILITDKSRLSAIYLIFAFFMAVVILVGKKHGLRALLSLALTFLVIVGFVIPRILDGAEPVKTVVFFSLIIVVASMLIVYGWNEKSKIAIGGMLAGVIITAVLTYAFSSYASLTGASVEEGMFLKEYLGNIDFRGLLLASFILGALGVLDDIAITQVSTAKEISLANENLSQPELYKKVMNVGVDHIASMINTLFLAYAGASFILLLLFGLNQPPFDSFNDVINNEVVATEIVRTMVGSIGLILTVPITTLIASHVYTKKYKEPNKTRKS